MTDKTQSRIKSVTSKQPSNVCKGDARMHAADRLHFRYSMFIQWSPADEAFLVTLPEWEGRTNNPTTHGDTYEEAAANARIVLVHFVSIALEYGQPLPEPKPMVIA
jgi:antitoxin HicB